MSWNHCSISGNILEEPVVSKKSGHIFEKKLIEKYIESTGNCPITNQPLNHEDLLPLKFNKTIQPRPVNATSIPNMIQIFQNEWDSVMLEVYTLKQHLEAVRQELSHALYQHDAACRVIARLIKERDEARQQLSSLMETVKNNSEIEIESSEKSFILPEPIIKQIQETHDNLFAMRKERKKKENVWADYSTLEAISQYSTKVGVPIHSSTKPGITALDVNPDTDRYVITGGNDSHVIIYDQQDSKIVCDFEKHSKKINEVAFAHRSDILRAVSCSEDHKANVFSFNPEDKTVTHDYTVNDHTDGVTGIAIHPIQSLLAVASRDSTITLHDIALGKLLNKIDSEKNSPYHSLKIHPDGTLLFAGTSSGVVKIWNIVDGSLITTVNAHQTEVDRIKFSENGVHFATGSTAENIVKIWDLRKMTNFKTFLEGQDFKLGDFTFDLSAQFFAIAGSSIMLYETKNWSNFTKFNSHQDLVTSVRFGRFSKSIISGSLDRHLNFYS